MAIVDPISDVYSALLTTPGTTAAFPSTSMSDIEAMDLDGLFVNTPTRRITEPLLEVGSTPNEVSSVLLDDMDEAEESSETDALEGLAVRTRRTRAVTTRQTMGSEDAFQSYLRDIRGL